MSKTYFDLNGQTLKKVGFGGYDPRSKTYRNRRVLFYYQNGNKYKQLACEYFVRQDTCVLRSFSNFKTDEDGRMVQEIKFEADSLIRFLRERKYEKSKITQTTYTWEFYPVKNINKDSAFKLTSISYVDNQGRDTLIIHYNERSKKSWKEIKTYKPNGYIFTQAGTAHDTTLMVEYDSLFILNNKYGINYDFNSSEKYKYEIIYYK